MVARFRTAVTIMRVTPNFCHALCNSYMARRVTMACLCQIVALPTLHLLQRDIALKDQLVLVIDSRSHKV